MIISAIFCILLSTIAYLDIRCMTIDPTDPLLYGNNDELQIMYEYECEFCNSYVSEKTKHWKVCNKCIKDFDHHWIWLNNWVGYNNYRLFFILICMYTVYNNVFIAIGAFVISEIAFNEIYLSSLAIEVFLSFELLIKLVIDIAILALLIFHIFLYFK